MHADAILQNYVSRGLRHLQREVVFTSVTLRACFRERAVLGQRGPGRNGEGGGDRGRPNNKLPRGEKNDWDDVEEKWNFWTDVRSQKVLKRSCLEVWVCAAAVLPAWPPDPWFRFWEAWSWQGRPLWSFLRCCCRPLWRTSACQSRIAVRSLQELKTLLGREISDYCDDCRRNGSERWRPYTVGLWVVIEFINIMYGF